MSVRIKLMPKHTLGFYIQLAAIGVMYRELESKLTEDFEELIFEKPSEYVEFVDGIFRALVESIVESEEDPCEVGKKYQKIRGSRPILYRAGVSDEKILREAGLNTTRCGEEAPWYSAAVSYVESVRNNGGPLGKRTRSIMLARTLVYGRFRDTMEEMGREEVQVDSLGLMLLGGLFSLVATVGPLEFYLLPDGSPESLRLATTVYEAFLRGERNGISFNSILRDFMNLEAGLSIDLATYIAALTYLLRTLEVMGPLAGLLEKEAFEKFLLARIISSGNRPQLVWMGPLTVSRTLMKIRGRGQILEDLLHLTWSSSKLKKSRSEEERKVGDKLASAVSKCINNVAIYTWTESLDLLLECSRTISGVADTSISLDRNTLYSMRSALKSIKALIRA